MSFLGPTFRIDDDALKAQNNILTLVRLCLASAVILTHSVWRVTGQADVDWFLPRLGVPISTIAVDGFFFLSGFLVFRSLAQRSLGSFMLARIARMFPGLSVSVLLTTLIGAGLTTAPGLEYLSGPTLRFLAGNLTFTKGYYTLTGIDCLGGPCNVNGSLWTLPWEMRCYVTLVALRLLHMIAPRRFAWIASLTLAMALAWHLLPLEAWLSQRGHAATVYYFDQIMRLWFMFALGCMASIWHRFIPLNPWVVAVLIAATAATAGMPIAFFVHAVMTGYAILYLGFGRWSFRQAVGKWPDYSYGIYIYAFPVMQVLAATIPGIGSNALAALNLACVVPIAALSWHFVEKPVLDLLRRRSAVLPRQAPVATGI